MGQDFPFDIEYVTHLVGLRIRRPCSDGVYTDCPFCGDNRGKLKVNYHKNIWRCNYCGEKGGMLRLYAMIRNVSTAQANSEICDSIMNEGLCLRMDDIVYEEFKGTGNMEIHLDRKLAEKRVFPAIDIYKSGTRREELLLSKEELEGVYMLRKFLAGGGTTEVTEQVVPMMAKTATNEDFLSKLKDWIKIYEKSGYTLSSQNRYGN